ncbi:hypothetical protein CDD83_10345 [Cordyceps sp. RAO-2017]|nr:hypothetical protein CDD83_10345 [Cordyceps sp. RAO-2017]
MFLPHRWRRLNLCLFLAATTLLLVAYLDDQLRDDALELVRPAWFYAIGLTRYDFKPSPDEQACLDGTARRVNAPGMPPAIPNIAHFVSGVDRPEPVSLMLWLSIRAAAANLGPGHEIRLHYVHLSEAGPWWNDVRGLVTLVPHQPGFLDDFAHLSPPPSKWDPAHKADVLRLQILRAEGGIYLDTDAIILRPLDKLLDGYRDVVLAYEGGHRRGLSNAVILAKPGAPFLERWYNSYNRFDAREWNYHSVILPAKLADQHAAEVCKLPPAAFYWPLWPLRQIDWMHAPLDARETAAVTAAMERTNGSLFDEQLIYHAWNHPAQKYMRNLTPERIKTENTRFNLLVRRYA